MNSWRKLQCLSWSERRLLIQALFLLPLTALILRLLGFRHWQSSLASLVPIADPQAGSQLESAVQRAHVTARMVRAAAWHGPYRAKCLQQALVLWWLLRRQGIHNELRIGVRKEGNRLEAHAWVEVLGTPVNDSDDVGQRFSPFDRAIITGGVESQ